MHRLASSAGLKVLAAGVIQAARPDGRARATVIALLMAMAPAAHAQSPRYGLGRTPSAAEIGAWDVAVGPDGKELPSGSGTAVEGKAVYATRCALCHGATGREGPQDILVGGTGTLASVKPLKTVGSYWPYATTLWDYVNRAMPFDHPGTLPPDQVYATVAYVLYLNGIIGEHDSVNAQTLPTVRMPNRSGFVKDPRPDVGRPPAPPAIKR